MKTTLLSVILMSFSLISFAHGPSKNEISSISPYDKLQISGNVNLVISDSGSDFRIVGNDKEAASIITQQNGSELIISRESNSEKDKPVTIYLAPSNLNTLIVSNEATVTCETTIHGNVLSILHKGSGAIKMRSDANLIQTMTTKSGRISIEGEYSSIVSRMDRSNHLIIAYSK